MRTAATATATATASGSAQDWRKQSHADCRHAEHDAQSPCDHCCPPLLGVIGTRAINDGVLEDGE
jgi:hypothetical protein